MKRIGIFFSVLVMVFGLSVSAQATLTDMGDGTVYDSTTQLSWLQDAGAGGQKDWATAKAWAEGLNVNGLTGWRLPTTAQPDPTCYAQGGGDSYGNNCKNSEMGHLFYTSLGNAAGVLTKTGPFTNLQADYYWSGTEYAPNPTPVAWYFRFGNGYQDVFPKVNTLYAWAVRPGARVVTPPCTGSIDGAWGACVNGTQTRTVTGFPNGCAGGVALDATSQACTPTPVGYNTQWLIITLVGLTLAGGILLRRKMV